MKQRLIIMAPEGAPQLYRLQQLLAELEYELVSNEPVADDGTPENIRLTELFPHDTEYGDGARVMTSGIATLGDATQLPAYQVWRRIGGRTDHNGKRYMGRVFRIVCQTMAKHGLQFADADPARFRHWDANTWKSEFGLSGEPANRLEYVEVLDAFLLTHLTDSDLAGISKFSRSGREEVAALRDRLKEL